MDTSKCLVSVCLIQVSLYRFSDEVQIPSGTFLWRRGGEGGVVVVYFFVT